VIGNAVVAFMASSESILRHFFFSFSLLETHNWALLHSENGLCISFIVRLRIQVMLESTVKLILVYFTIYICASILSMSRIRFLYRA